MAVRSKGYRPVSGSIHIGESSSSSSSSSSEDDGKRDVTRTRKINRIMGDTIMEEEEDREVSKARSPYSSRFSWPSNRQFISAGIGLVAGSIAALLPLGFPSADAAAQRCLGILVAAAIWWVLEPWPPYVTSLHLGLLIVISRVMRVPDPSSMALVPARIVGSEIGESEALPPSAAAILVSAAFFDPVIFLFISGFAMGQALEKFHITERLATRLLSRVSTGGDRLAIVILLLGLLVSGALSNVAAAVLLTAVVAPVARELTDSESKRAILGVAFGCNVGGMITPIASPQNVIALVALRSNGGSDLSFMQWIIFALPVCAIAAASVFVVLKFMYNGRRSDAKMVEMTERRRNSSEGIVAITVFLWMIFDIVGLDGVFGSMGMVGLMAVVALHSLGILTTEDWHGMQWSVLTLLGGGVALGNAVESSGLLRIIADEISKSLEGSSVWASAVCFFLCTGLVANFLSSTVCAIVALPVVAKVGAVVGHPRLFTVGCAFMTSAAMGLPVSSFPNANAAGVVNLSLPGAPTTPILQSRDFVKSVIISTVGYAWAMFLGWYHKTCPLFPIVLAVNITTSSKGSEFIANVSR
ncbi:Membrane protein, putative [Perkinsus marinus ATCC 50983]|uniref:Membrane protein, putative n=1 Tax=Perkinsus marinus (strain ATCC 50983 / TXsc) TaxID=423536 RepID=C5KDV5_PERM5|nr:Membrane protein, putative [Perkinsus marinus ATCC 50983]EER17408.1 Membrane protein, putative [Perkinsus marinus ATCC 50983]|eukprot:XP_002785612.1 Membrane protein, putative [Perkinsus marinus ATCC 50983]